MMLNILLQAFNGSCSNGVVKAFLIRVRNVFLKKYEIYFIASSSL